MLPPAEQRRGLPLLAAPRPINMGGQVEQPARQHGAAFVTVRVLLAMNAAAQLMSGTMRAGGSGDLGRASLDAATALLGIAVVTSGLRLPCVLLYTLACVSVLAACLVYGPGGGASSAWAPHLRPPPALRLPPPAAGPMASSLTHGPPLVGQLLALEPWCAVAGLVLTACAATLGGTWSDGSDSKAGPAETRPLLAGDAAALPGYMGMPSPALPDRPRAPAGLVPVDDWHTASGAAAGTGPPFRAIFGAKIPPPVRPPRQPPAVAWAAGQQRRLEAGREADDAGSVL